MLDVTFDWTHGRVDTKMHSVRMRSSADDTWIAHAQNRLFRTVTILSSSRRRVRDIFFNVNATTGLYL